MPFRITVDGESITTEDLTLDECVEIEKEAEEAWSFVILAPLKSAAHARAVLTKVMARKHGPEEAAKRAGAMTFSQVLDAFEHVEDDQPKQYQDGMPVVDPKAASAETSIGTSSPPPTTGDGPPT